MSAESLQCRPCVNTSTRAICLQASAYLASLPVHVCSFIEVNTAADDTKNTRMDITTGVNSFSDCVAKCGATCMFATYDYVAKSCTIRVHVEPTYVG